MYIDLCYNTDTPAGSASEIYGPVGDPRWFDSVGLNVSALTFAQHYVDENSGEHGQSTFNLITNFNLTVDGENVSGGLGGNNPENCEINWPTDPYVMAVYSFVSEYVLEEGGSVGCFLDDSSLEQTYAYVAEDMESIWLGDDDDEDVPPGAVHVATMSAGASGTTNLFIVGLNINLEPDIDLTDYNVNDELIISDISRQIVQISATQIITDGGFGVALSQGDPIYILPETPVEDNYSLIFDGVDDYVDVGSSVDINLSSADFTINAWI